MNVLLLLKDFFYKMNGLMKMERRDSIKKQENLL